MLNKVIIYLMETLASSFHVIISERRILDVLHSCLWHRFPLGNPEAAFYRFPARGALRVR